MISKRTDESQGRSQTITSASNPLLRSVRRAAHSGTPTDDGSIIAEGFHLLDEAIGSDSRIEAVIACQSVRSTVERRIAGLQRVRLAVVPDELFRDIATTEATQGVITLVQPQPWELDHVLRPQTLAVIVDGIQDPGNAGAIMRAAEAFSATGIVFLKGSVNPYNPKAVRASAGSVFRLPMVWGLDPLLVRAALEQRRIDIYAAMPGGKLTLTEADLRRRCALVIGSEGRGVSTKLHDAAFDLRIPTSGVESLNAAVAAGILLYEARRQRLLPA